MSEEKKEQAPIIIIKKNAGHGHHGGAWKVAYADFVTAMMAFFMVMWLLNAGEKAKEAIAGYFNDPVGFKGQLGSGSAGQGDGLSITKKEIPELKNKLEQALREMPKFEQMKDQVQFTVTGEGLRIELLETEKGMFFESGSSKPSKEGVELLATMAAEIGKMDNKVVLEGHTDSKAFSGEGYTNWELSSDRANAARRLMTNSGMRPDQIIQVRGFADQRLFKKDDAEHASNRRVSIIVQYKDPKKNDKEALESDIATNKPEAPKDGHGKKDDHGKADDHAKPAPQAEPKAAAKH